MSYEPRIDAVLASKPKLIPVMITLTVKNGPDLRERMAHLKNSWKKMIAARRRGKSGKCHDGLIEWNKVEGALRSIEVTKGKDGWHPHIHCFALVSDWIDQAKLSEEWKKITGDSFVVGVTLCKNGVRAGLIESVKYALKFADLNPLEIWEVFKAADGSRFFDPSGVLRGVPEPDIDSDDLDLEGDYREFLALWDWARSAFQMMPVPAPPFPIGGPSAKHWQADFPRRPSSPKPRNLHRKRQGLPA
jgi:hypothetical protein